MIDPQSMSTADYLKAYKADLSKRIAINKLSAQQFANTQNVTLDSSGNVVPTVTPNPVLTTNDITDPNSLLTSQKNTENADPVKNYQKCLSYLHKIADQEMAQQLIDRMDINTIIRFNTFAHQIIEGIRTDFKGNSGVTLNMISNYIVKFLQKKVPSNDAIPVTAEAQARIDLETARHQAIIAAKQAQIDAQIQHDHDMAQEIEQSQHDSKLYAITRRSQAKAEAKQQAKAAKAAEQLNILAKTFKNKKALQQLPQLEPPEIAMQMDDIPPPPPQAAHIGKQPGIDEETVNFYREKGSLANAENDCSKYITSYGNITKDSVNILINDINTRFHINISDVYFKEEYDRLYAINKKNSRKEVLYDLAKKDMQNVSKRVGALLELGIGTGFKKNGGKHKNPHRVILGKGKDQQPQHMYQSLSNKYLLDLNKLNNNILLMKYEHSRCAIAQMKSIPISDDVKEIIKDIISDKFNQRAYNSMSLDDRRIIQQFIRVAKLNIPITDEDDKEKQRQYQLCLDEWQAGNDSLVIKRRLKKFILEFVQEGKLSVPAGNKMIMNILE